MLLPTDRLDADSFRYLKAVEANSGHGFHGVFVRRPPGWFEGPRSGWGLALFLGLTLLAGAGALSWPRFLENVNLNKPAYVQGSLVAVGVALLLAGVARFRRKTDHALTRSFLIADARHLWDVRPDQVEALDLTDLIGIDGRHRFLNGRYDSSTLTLYFPATSRTVWVTGQRATEELLSFLQVLTGLRGSSDPNLQQIVAASPELLGAAALRLARDGGNADLTNLDAGATLPLPRDDSSGMATAKPGWGGAVARCAAAGAIGAAALFAFPVLNRELMEDHLFARIPAKDTGDVSALEKYLAIYPTGRHSAEVRVWLDDRRFTRAESEFRQFGSPKRLRAYLADAADTRHRDEAKQLLDRCYDTTIEDLKTRAKGTEAKVDPALFAAIVSLLDTLRSAPEPIVPVGFKATIDPEPVTAEQKALQQMMIDGRLRDFPELKDVAARQPDGTPILPRGAVFDTDQIQRRERVILERLIAAVRQGVREDILTLRAAEPGQVPVLEVAYHISAQGNLYTYTMTDNTVAGAAPRNNVKGLLRGYSIDWTITVRPPGTDKVHVCQLGSVPASNLNYDAAPGDPDWAPYAIILYSGFYDMSARLIRNFALDPGKPPNAFTFGAVASTKADIPANAPLPAPPNGPGIPPIPPAPPKR